VVQAELLDVRTGAHPAASEFMARYDKYRFGKTTTYSFSEEPLAQAAIAYLRDHKIKVEVYRDMTLAPDEIEGYPAVFLTIEGATDLFIEQFYDPSVLAKRDIAQDFETQKIIVTDRARELISRASIGVRFDAVEGTDGDTRHVLRVDKMLDDPIDLPGVLEIVPNDQPPGTVGARCDGRHVLSRRDTSMVRECGVVVATQVRGDGAVHRIAPPYILSSGRLMHRLLEAELKGLVEPITPLLLHDEDE
jgi:hypothetical protein